MKIIEIVESNQKVTERPMGMIQHGLNKLGAKLPGSLGAKAQGKIDTGTVANQLYKEFATYLGRTGQKATDESLRAFLQQKGADKEIDIDKIISAVAPVSETSSSLGIAYTEATSLGRSALNKAFMQVAQGLAGAGSGATLAARSNEPSASAPKAAPAARSNAPKAATTASGSATAADTSAPQSTVSNDPEAGQAAPAAAPAKGPSILKRAAGAVGNAIKGAFNKPAGAAPAQGQHVEPKVAAPAPALGGTAPAAKPAAQGQGSGIEGYVQNWAKTINATKDPNEKIKLAKEIVGFLGDRKGQPEAERAIGQASAVLKRSGLNPSINSKFLRALSTGAKMERRMYALANALLEATGLTWKHLGIRVIIAESTADHVTLKAR
jgi:hypothetical protein